MIDYSCIIEGHGTHVSGSVAGNSMGEFGDMDGMAPDAKISFFDIGGLRVSHAVDCMHFSQWQSAY